MVDACWNHNHVSLRNRDPNPLVISAGIQKVWILFLNQYSFIEITLWRQSIQNRPPQTESPRQCEDVRYRNSSTYSRNLEGIPLNIWSRLHRSSSWLSWFAPKHHLLGRFLRLTVERKFSLYYWFVLHSHLDVFHSGFVEQFVDFKKLWGIQVMFQPLVGCFIVHVPNLDHFLIGVACCCCSGHNQLMLSLQTESAKI